MPTPPVRSSHVSRIMGRNGDGHWRNMDTMPCDSSTVNVVVSPSGFPASRYTIQLVFIGKSMEAFGQIGNRHAIVVDEPADGADDAHVLIRIGGKAPSPEWGRQNALLAIAIDGVAGDPELSGEVIYRVHRAGPGWQEDDITR